MSTTVDPPTDNRPCGHVRAGPSDCQWRGARLMPDLEPAELEGASAMTVTVEPTTAEPNPSHASQALRPHAEYAFAAELAALSTQDDRPRPARWKLSPWAVATYLLG